MQNTAPMTVNHQVLSTMNILEPDDYKALVGRYPMYRGLSYWKMLYPAQNRTKHVRKARQMTIRNWEMGDHIARNLEVESVDNATANVTKVTIADAYHYQGNANIRKTDLVKFPNGARGFVEEVDRTADANVATIRGLNTHNVQAAATAMSAGQEIIVYSNAQTEESSEIEGRITPRYPFTTKLQTIREDLKVTDYAHIAKLAYYKVGDQGYLFDPDLTTKMDNFEMNIEMAQLIGEEDGGSINYNGKSVGTMQGFIPEAIASGITGTWDPAANPVEPGWEFFDDMRKLINQKHGPTAYTLLGGLDWTSALLKMVYDFASNTGTEFNFSQIPGGKEQAIAMHLKGVSIGGLDIAFREIPAFSKPNMLGAVGHEYDGAFMGIPVGTINTMLDGESLNVSYLQHVYADHDIAVPLQQGMDHAIWESGAMAKGGPTNGTMQHLFHCIGHFGVEFFSRHLFMYYTKA